MAKHPVPKKKTSKARGSRRYKSFQNKARIRLTEAAKLVKCANCGAAVKAHNACLECGFYKGKDVMSAPKPVVDSKEKIEKEEVTTIKAE